MSITLPIQYPVFQPVIIIIHRRATRMRTRRKLCPNEFTINFLPHNIRSLSHKYIHTLLLFDQHPVTFTGAAAPAAAAGWMGCLSRRRQLITCLFAPSSDKIKCKLRCPLLSSLSVPLPLSLPASAWSRPPSGATHFSSNSPPNECDSHTRAQQRVVVH